MKIPKVIHEFFCIGCFQRHPTVGWSINLRSPAARTISPIVEQPFHRKAIHEIAHRIIGDLSEEHLNKVLFDGGVIIVDGYLECNSDKLNDIGREFIKQVFLHFNGVLVANCMGEIVSLDDLGDL